MDARTIRTKTAIRKAFFELLIQKEMQDITLTEISLKANVNRQTLYKYYSGVREILDDVVATLFDYYKKIIYKVDVINCFETPMIIFNKINHIVKDDIDFYRQLFTMKHNLLIKQIISDSLFDIVNKVFKQNHVFPIEKVDIITTYLVHGIIGTYEYYFEHEYLNLDEYSKYVGDLVFGGLKKQIKIN